MTPAFSTRRRADEFEALVSGGRETEQLTERDAARFAKLLAVVSQLRAVPDVNPRSDFVASLRERLMVEADTALVAGDPEEARLRLPVRGGRRERRLATLIGSAAVIGATTTMAVAAQTALPGDSLYPVKRALESAQAQLAGDEGERGAAMLASATDRLEEVDELARRGTTEGIAALAPTLETFTAQSDEAAELLLSSYEDTGDEAAITELRRFTEQSMETLLRLEAAVPDSARDELRAAAQNLAAIDDRTRTLCPTCPGEGIAAIPAILLSAGIVPAAGVPPVPSAEAPLVPASRTGDAEGGSGDSTGGRDRGVQLPDLEEPIDPEGGATGGGGEDGPGGGAPTDQPTQDPVTELANALLGSDKDGGKTGGGGKTSTSTPGDPVNDVVDGVGTVLDGIDQTTGGLLD